MRPFYHIARYQAVGVRKLYSRRLKTIARREIEPAGELARDVVYFSSRQDLPEQVASIRSLIRYAGQPEQILVVTDGTHSQSDRALLRALSEVVRVVDYGDVASPDLPGEVAPYARAHAFGKKLGLLLSLPLAGPAAYVDSDVLFFPGAASEPAREVFSRSGIWYLPNVAEDASFLDTRMVSSPEEATRPVNAGFLLCDRRLRWEDAVARMPALPDVEVSSDTLTRVVGDTEQTLVHLAVHHSDGHPLPTSLFQLRVDDQFLYRDFTPRRTAAMRHYTMTVRNKFWLAVAAVPRFSLRAGLALRRA